jgi:hypothetical protein
VADALEADETSAAAPAKKRAAKPAKIDEPAPQPAATQPAPAPAPIAAPVAPATPPAAVPAAQSPAAVPLNVEPDEKLYARLREKFISLANDFGGRAEAIEILNACGGAPKLGEMKPEFWQKAFDDVEVAIAKKQAAQAQASLV